VTVTEFNLLFSWTAASVKGPFVVAREVLSEEELCISNRDFRSGMRRAGDKRRLTGGTSTVVVIPVVVIVIVGASSATPISVVIVIIIVAATE